MVLTCTFGCVQESWATAKSSSVLRWAQPLPGAQSVPRPLPQPGEAQFLPGRFQAGQMMLTNEWVLNGRCSGAGGDVVGTELVSPSAVARPEIVVNADGDRGTPCIVARRGEGADEEWLVGVSA